MKKITIVAEIGVNHNGNVRLAKKMIKEAIKCGADIVKFQTFFAEEFVKSNTKKAKYQLLSTNKKESHYEMIKKLELKRSDFKEVKKYCDKNKIEFLSTQYDIKSVELLEELKVKRYKIASADLVDMILHKKIRSTKKPLILSIGMAEVPEIKKTVEYYKKKKISNITLLHCVSNYPCSSKSLNLKTILKLKKMFNLPIGFSDHSEGNSAAVLAVGLGATIIEKHFTLNKNLPGPDHKASLNPKEFSIFVKTIREAEIMLGDGQKKCQLEEREMRRVGRKSITLKRSMKRGEKINEKDNIKKDHQIRKQDIF